MAESSVHKTFRLPSKLATKFEDKVSKGQRGKIIKTLIQLYLSGQIPKEKMVYSESVG